MKQHSVIIVPGLSDRTLGIKIVVAWWHLFGLQPLVLPVIWKEGKFKDKLDMILGYIEALSNAGHDISLIGISAGGSAVLNAYIERPGSIKRIVSICGYLRNNAGEDQTSFKKHATENPAFGESVSLFEKRENELINQDRKKILTVRARFGDELIPDRAAFLVGATNLQIFSRGHALSIALALTLYFNRIISFLKP